MLKININAMMSSSAMIIIRTSCKGKGMLSVQRPVLLRLKVLLISSIIIRKNKIKINNNNIIQDISDHL